MTRRTALALAASVALSVAGATFAVGTTLGMFGAAHTSGPTGMLSPVAAAPAEPERPRVQTVYVDVTASPEPARPASRAAVPAPPPPPAAAPAGQAEEVVTVEEPAPAYATGGAEAGASDGPVYEEEDEGEHEDEIEHEDDEYESDDDEPESDD
ncbi:MAG TPA: hypothetical protein VNQ77_05040 [Frankiaceae bacterium]|nr:hypothetical protein [Frankiaceae bacterium]